MAFGVTQREMCQQVRSLSQRDMVHAASNQKSSISHGINVEQIMAENMVLLEDVHLSAYSTFHSSRHKNYVYYNNCSRYNHNLMLFQFNLYLFFV